MKLGFYRRTKLFCSGSNIINCNHTYEGYYSTDLKVRINIGDVIQMMKHDANLDRSTIIFNGRTYHISGMGDFWERGFIPTESYEEEML
jgi:hypothetical protein